MDTDDAKLPMVTQNGAESSPKLPRDIFKTRSRWRCYKLYKSIAIRIVLLIFLIAQVLATFYGGIEGFGICLIPASILIPISALIVMITGSSLGLKGQMEFLVQVTTLRPGLDISRWDIIASRMNEYMLNTGKWLSEDCFFFDGEECLKYFREWCILPSQREEGDKKLDNTDTPLNTKDDPTETQQSDKTPINLDPYWNCKELKPYIARAVEAYNEDVNTSWERACAMVIGSSSVEN